MATQFSTVMCYTCCSDLTNCTKHRVIIRDHKTEYATLYGLAVDILKAESKITDPPAIHGQLDKIICLQCSRVLKRYSTILESIEPIKKKTQERFFK